MKNPAAIGCLAKITGEQRRCVSGKLDDKRDKQEIIILTITLTPHRRRKLRADLFRAALRANR